MRRAAIAMAIPYAITCASCAAPRPFPLRAPVVVDTDLLPVSVPCRLERGDHPRDGSHWNCAPREYVSPFVWDQIDNIWFAPLSRALSVEVWGEAVNVNSLDEVPDSAWFTNRPRAGEVDAEADAAAPGACTADDVLPPPDDVHDASWLIDHGKDNGSTLGFRIKVPEKGQYMLKADDPGKPERASAASVIGAAMYHALGFYTSCEQIVVLRKAQLKLGHGLMVVDNSGVSHPFDDAALDKVLATTTQLPGHLVRMQASKWLPGLAIGPFRYVGTRDDDPSDVIDHADRRELRGMRVLAAWLDHWDSREQNSMDVWLANDPRDKRSSPGRVVHYVLDTSDSFGEDVSVAEMSRRLGYSYDVDFAEIGRSLLTLGAEDRPWDHARVVPGREKFGYYRAEDFDPPSWKPMYPNPAFLRMTERDAAWMARLIARFSHDDIRRFVALGKWQDPGDADFLANILIERQRRILVRYLGKLSPLGEIRPGDAGRICATDFARLREIAAPDRFRYTISEVAERGARRALERPAELGAGGAVCFRPQPVVTGALPDVDPGRIVRFEIANGTPAAPLVIWAYDLGRRGMQVAGLTRPEP
ncbi:MAG TPA: hypothetical protein VHW23_08335 [Kofleriaceae bacterium]|jgi:hypothetical protein|nr:hypothetical protein [Kofleriaceae bacterium]